MTPRRHRKQRISEINVVPYIDIMLVLLIIFMITTPLLTNDIQVELPKVTISKNASPRGTVLLVTVDKQGQIFLQNNELPMSKEVLVQRLQTNLTRNPGLQVFLAGAGDTPYQNIAELIALLRERLSLDEVNLVVQ